ncbi:WecB/TagA/CpsF family glycosyltransferase [Candidatus Parcubacteria bacterium]|nr:MAG: WecB/TagA/CpsF family glycosyltransferase [Candidatus Parcubacteria bacterium]
MTPILMVTILGVKIDNISKSECLNKIREFLQSQNQHYIVTPNPEFLVAAQKDNEFKKILNDADLSIADGVGLKFGSFFKIKHRITGADLMFDICKLAEQNMYSVYLVGGKQDIAKRTAYKLKEKFSDLKISGWQDGMEAQNTDVEKIKNANPDILFVAFGQVKQEKWIYENLKRIPSAKLAMGVGGAFDYISGEIKRSPYVFRIIGLEWLYRLVKEPKRIKRIYNAIIRFPFYVILNLVLSVPKDNQN